MLRLVFTLPSFVYLWKKNMKTFILTIIILSAITGYASAQSSFGTIDRSKKIDTLEVSCGMCQFEMQGDDCALAVRLKDKTYYVEGTHIDDHGDAHAKDGFCNKIRKAEVQGELKGNKYKVSYFKLLPIK